MTEQFDAGDILLQEKIKIEQEDHLVTLLEKIKKVSVKLLSEYLSSPDEIWDHARAQGEGEYWEEPGDLERTFSLEDTVEKISTTLRAFYGYGSLCNLQGLPVEIVRGSRFYVMKSCIDTIGARYRYKKTVRIIYVIKNRRYSKRSIPRRQ